MQKDDNEKTELGRKLLFTGVALACLAGVGAWWIVRGGIGTEPGREDVSPFTYQVAHLTAGGREFTLDVADTAGKQHLGLGQRTSLEIGEGMIFVYPKPGERCFWMKDMRFSIDIIWLDADKKVIHVEPSLSPDTYPQTYCPKEGAQYVLELGAGTAGSVGLKVGDIAVLSL